MKRYEAMVIVKPDLSEEEKKALFGQINEVVIKNKGSVSAGDVWSDKRNFCFPITKYQEGIYYLLKFSLTDTGVIAQIRRAYKLNENILRVLITKLE